MIPQVRVRLRLALLGTTGVIAMGSTSQRGIVMLEDLVTPRQPREDPTETLERRQSAWGIDARHGASATLVQMPWFQSLYEQAWQVPDTNVLVFRTHREALP